MDNFTPEMSEKMVQYLDGELSGVEKADLEQKLAAEKILQAELERLQSAREAVKQYGLRQKVAFIHGQMMDEQQPPMRKMSSFRKNIRYSVAVAASLLLLIGAYVTYNFSTLSPDKVFAANYRTYEMGTVRSGTAGTASAIEESFAQKEYAKVVSIAFDRPFTPKENLLRGMAFIELGNNVNAINELKLVINDNGPEKSNLLKQEAEYYLALTHIRDKEYGFAVALLKKIKHDPAHLYNEKVTRKLIRQVKMLSWK